MAFDKLKVTTPGDLVKPEVPEKLVPDPIVPLPKPELDASLTLREKAWYQWLPTGAKIVEILTRNTVVGKVLDIIHVLFPPKAESFMNNDRKTTLFGAILAALQACFIDYTKLLAFDLTEVGKALAAIITAVLGYYINKPSN